MEASSANPLISSQRSSQLHAVLHPLVLLTISDYITRHTLRQQSVPIIGALLGQQNGRDITIEHAFDCHLVEAPNEEGGYLLDGAKFTGRLEQMTTVHKDRQLDFVGWYTLLPAEGPTPTILPIHNQILQGWNESAVLLGFHPREVLNHSFGGKLPLTIYESNYEADESKSDHDGEDKKMDDGEPPLRLRFREVPYSVETDETEMISMNYIASGGGNAAAVASKDAQPSRSVESNGKGKRRLVESEPEGSVDIPQDEESGVTLTREEEETLAALTAKANAVKMLQSRIQLLTAYLDSLPTPSSIKEAADGSSMDTDASTVTPSLTVLREIKALTGRLGLVIPSDDESFNNEMVSEKNDVDTINLLSTLMQSIVQVREVGKKFAIVDGYRNTQQRRAEYPGTPTFSHSNTNDLLL
ncbi:COP9 signalosome subunit 6 (CsnF), putative [Cordyceps militaris CM01]|uniref:COP9 signalosome complex subunit 6 n=1 Tax=Cordyceps militaris (strain CM01) TaxID=983644 RepID=G3JDZ0_CORMM|nr:COP9 signalosome subunit 6 (CsnF), putative [Cordyceps militaris CM01]EGX92815.1 COP9 signalosome subunit 6 (CsnF), putative [Cordyceps militaris CM01]